jgi:hypothetical protein
MHIMSGIYLLLPAALLLAGILPLLYWNRRVKVNLIVYILGWLAWFSAVSVKNVIATIEFIYFPNLFTSDILLVTNSTALETIEVISAFLFLACLPALRDVRDWVSIVAFGLGFGCGEALTLGVVALSSIYVPFSLSFIAGDIFLGGFVERLAATGIHLSSAAFLAFFLINSKARDFILGLASKDLTASIATIFGVIALPFAVLLNSALIELVFVVYAAFWIAVLLYIKKRDKIPEDLPRREISVNYGHILIAAVVFFCSISFWTFSNPVSTSSPIVGMAANLVFIFTISIAIYLILRFLGKVSTTELVIGSAASFTVFVAVLNTIYGLGQNAAALLEIATIPFFGVLCAAGAIALYLKIRDGKQRITYVSG